MLKARIGRLKCLLELQKQGELPHEQKVMFREDLDTIIAHIESGDIHPDDKSEAAGYYLLRAQVYAGKYPNVCGKTANGG